jgi:predicted membrane protein
MKPQHFIGTVLIIIGLAFLLDQFNVMGFSQVISTWWPIVIIVVGIYSITRNINSFFSGAVILEVGVLLQADNLDILPNGFWSAFWPIFLIIIGISFIVNRAGKKNRKISWHDNHEEFVLFSGAKKTIVSDNFMGSSMSVMFGGAEIDLTHVKLGTNEPVLDFSVIFGGIDLRVPEGWIIKQSGLPIFGGFSDKTRRYIDTPENPVILHIKYSVIFGGIDVKN